ncbi:PAS domain-containing protein [uncultured Nitrospira sp.]|uniref:PAS domain-containing response regulator n=1 Tax=uncultured Nitrospira sp. TaxID=157176 RepID=UPI0031404E49
METARTSQPRILVVDDETDICLALSDLLGNEGYQVEAVETGNEALRRVSSPHPYSAVILDLGLPDLDGLIVLQRLHGQDATLPVIILTAHGDQKEKITSLQHHAFAHLIKPYDRQEVIEMVHRAVAVKNLTWKAAQAEEALTSSETQRQLEQQHTHTLLSESEQRLHLALKAGNMGIWDWDIVSNQVIWSEDVPGLFGLTEGPLPRTLEEFLPYVHPHDRALTAEALRATLEEDAPYYLDHRIVWPSGEVRWLSCKGQVTHDSQGRPQRMLGTIQDITTRKQQDLQLRESESRFREVVEAIREVFWVSNPEKTEILYISPGYESIWGRSCSGLYASPQSWMDAIHPEDKERIRARALTKQTLGSYDEEYRIITLDESIRWIRDRAFPVIEQGGKVQRIVGVAEDITERKQVQHGLQALAEASWELTGPPLFETLVWEMAAILNVKFAFIAEHLNGKRARTHASWADGSIADPMEYSLSGTPCEEAWKGNRCFWGDHVRQHFPDDQWLTDEGIESYLAYPIRGLERQVIGHVAVMDVRPMAQDPFWGGILEFVALRAALEFRRMNMNPSSSN